MKSLIRNCLSILGALGFLVCMGMLLTRPTNFASYIPDLVEVIEETFEDPTVFVMLDPGHGGIDGGSSNQSLLEKNLALKVCQMVQRKVTVSGLPDVEVVLTRDEDLYLSLYQRVAMANRLPKCFFVSVHFNASRHRSASGTETYYASPKPPIIQNQVLRKLRRTPGLEIVDDRGLQFAEIVQASVVRAIGSRDRGVRNNPKLVLPREIIGPAVLVECVFLSNQREAAQLRQTAFLEDIADGITEGILTYLRQTDRDPFAGVTVVSEEGVPAETEPSAPSAEF